MFAFLRKQKRRTEFAPYPSGYTPDEFRSNPGLVVMAESWRRSALGGHMMAAVHNGIPSGYPMRGQPTDPTTAAVELGRIQGYMDCLNLLQLLCTPIPQHKEVDQDYGAKEILDAEGVLYPKE